ncbi:MAG: hypothetical protein GY722_09905 [bacterium]|nr:hypothetical protein [bacterium]
MSEVKIGEIALLQVHGDLLKLPEKFDPAPLIEVAEASVDADGMLGWTGSAWVVDVHHRAWPGRSGRRPLSIGFTSHYDQMRARFRDVPLGAAGENIVIRADDVFKLADLGDHIIIRGRDGEVALTSPDVAKPCLPFTSYMLDLPAVGALQEIGYDVKFLDDGMRGFIVGIDESVEPFRIRVGDEVLLNSQEA